MNPEDVAGSLGAVGGLLAGGIMVFLLIFLVMAILPIIAYWKIIAKTGNAGPMALLLLIPIVNLIVLYWLAFGDWPALRQTQNGYAPQGYPPPDPPPAYPPPPPQFQPQPGQFQAQPSRFQPPPGHFHPPANPPSPPVQAPPMPPPSVQPPPIQPQVQPAPPPAPGAAMFCGNCGARLPAGSQFCTSCGSRMG
jgi:hypothetical protein